MVKPATRLARCEPQDVHGGADPTELAQLGLRLADVLDFSANLNPFAPRDTARRAIDNATLNRYPDRSCSDLCNELARRHDVPRDQLLIGNGSAELIWLSAIAYLEPGDRVVILGPTFGGYQRAALLMGAHVIACDAHAENDFAPPLDAFADAWEKHRPRLAFFANPNNPTGKLVPAARILGLAMEYPDTLFVLDEAYVDCQPLPTAAVTNPPANLLRLRSLTKAHGLAGVRLGYALGAPEIIAALRAAQPTWSVNALAQAAGLAALRDESLMQRGLARWFEAAAQLVDALKRERFAPMPSMVPFFLLRVRDARRARSLLLRHHILVRDCTSFGLPAYIRISPLPSEENARLVAALVQLRQEISA